MEKLWSGSLIETIRSSPDGKYETMTQIRKIIGSSIENFEAVLETLSKSSSGVLNFDGALGTEVELIKASVDQLDIGIQTFDESLRKILMVRDRDKHAKLKLRAVKKHGLRVSIDLLYNLPGQSLEQWKADLKQAVELNVESVDCYPLDLYPDTPLANKIASGELAPDGGYKKELDMYLEAYRFFKENGYLPTCHNRFSRIKEDFNKTSSEVIGKGAGFFMGHIGNFNVF